MKSLAVLFICLFVYGVHSQSYEFLDERRFLYNSPQVIPYPIDTTPCYQPYLPPVELTYEVRPPCQNYLPQLDIRPPCQCQSCLPQVDIKPPCPNYLPQVVDLYPPYFPQIDVRPPCQSCQSPIDIRPPCQCQLPQAIDIFPPFQNFVPQPIDIRPPCPCQSFPQAIDIRTPCQNYLPQIIDVNPPCQTYLPPVVDVRPPCQCGYQATECVKQTIETSYPVDYITPYQVIPQVETVTQTIEICTEPAEIPCGCSRPKPCSCQSSLSPLIPYIETTLEDNSLSNSLANVLQTLIVSKLLSRTQPPCEVPRPCDLYDYIPYEPSYRCPCKECQYPQYFAPGPVYPPFFY